MTYFHSRVFVACLKSKAKASWLFLASEGCLDLEEPYSGICVISETPPENAPPPFWDPENFGKPRRGPVQVRFEVLKYVKGFHCQLWSQKILRKRGEGARLLRLDL